MRIIRNTPHSPDGRPRSLRPRGLRLERKQHQHHHEHLLVGRRQPADEGRIRREGQRDLRGRLGTDRETAGRTRGCDDIGTESAECERRCAARRSRGRASQRGPEGAGKASIAHAAAERPCGDRPVPDAADGCDRRPGRGRDSDHLRARDTGPQFVARSSVEDPTARGCRRAYGLTQCEGVLSGTPGSAGV